MNFKEILAAQKNKTCILSVEKITDSQYGNIRIVEGNKAHYADMLNTLHHPFVPDSPYEVYFPKDKNFEDFCFRSAFLGQPLHTYVPLPQMGLWLNMFL
ncbi:MAG: GGDEF domain-containing protein, partial [Lachnospiraceae bacterium]|nr:GGDEF domain-containing protein [Lachnospiraceae bacterium]